MNLISCDNCGVVLDANKIDFPYDLEIEEGCIDLSKAMWDIDTDCYVAFVECPVCHKPIKEPT